MLRGKSDDIESIDKDIERLFSALFDDDKEQHSLTQKEFIEAVKRSELLSQILKGIWY